MEVLNDLIFDIWKHVLIVPVFLRQVLLLILFTLLVRPVLFVIIPFLVRLFINTVVYILNQIVAFFSWCFSGWMTARRKRGKGALGLITFSETILDLISEAANRLKKAAFRRPELKWKLSRAYIWVAVLLVIGFPFLYYSQPQLAVSQKWNEVETWMLAGQSVSKVAAAREDEGENDQAQVEKVLLELKPKYDGGTIRKEPGLNTGELAVIGSGELVRYMGKKAQEDEIVWVLVQLENGKKGWISSNIVQVSEK